MTPVMKELKAHVRTEGKYDEPWVILCKICKELKWNPFLNKMDNGLISNIQEGRTYLNTTIGSLLGRSVELKAGLIENEISR